MVLLRSTLAVATVLVVGPANASAAEAALTQAGSYLRTALAKQVAPRS